MTSDCATNIRVRFFRCRMVLYRLFHWIPVDPQPERDDDCGQYDEAEREPVMHGFASSRDRY
jgi:hypothetical protein